MGERQAHIVEGLRPAVERLQAVHQHNLAVKAQEVIFVEPLHHFLAVVVKAIAQHPDVTVFIRHRQFGFAPAIDVRPREELQRGRARHFARQHKPARLNKVQPLLFALMKIISPGLGNRRQTVFVRRCQRVQPRAEFAPFCRPLRALPLQKPGHLPRPAQVVLGQHRQIEQPFAGIIDNFQIERGRVFKMA
ncbi:hypothetical protein D3C72_1483050 [compost metagenome]